MMDWVIVASVAAGIGAIAAAAVAGYQAWLLRNSTIADLILKFDEQFNETLWEKRKKAAKSLKQGPSEHDPNIEDVLDFFETLGFLTKWRCRALSKSIVWHTFFYWIHGYWRYSHQFIERQQLKSPKRYADFQFIHEKTYALEIKQRGPINENEWDDFLELEADGAGD